MGSLQQLCASGSLAVVLALLACRGDNGTAPPEAANLTLVSSPTLSGTAGKPITAPIVVKVTSSGGTGVPGVMVSFTSGANSGSVSQTTVVTDDEGIATTTWTLGTRAGANIDTVRASVSELPGAAVTVTATVTPAGISTLAIESGDAQSGTAGAPLAEPLVVIAHDQFGNPVAHVGIAWSVEGGGSLSATSSTTAADGKTAVTWTLGTGTNRAHATASGLPNAPVTFTASFTSTGAVVLSTISPATLVEGESATLRGTGFSPTLADDKVFVDGVAATVTSATTTALTITIPAFDCRPARDVDVRVAVKGDNSNAVSHPMARDEAVFSLAVGQEAVIRDPTAFCLQFDASDAGEEYLIGVQSTSEVASSFTPVALAGVGATTTLAMASPSPVAPRRAFMTGGSALAILTGDRSRRWARHRTAEARLRAWERDNLAARMRSDALRAPTPSSSVAALGIVPSGTSVGDTIRIHVPDANGNACSSFIAITTVARAVGTRGVWLEDIANPEGGYTTADFQRMSTMLDDAIYDTDVNYFGDPQDIDGNDRIIVVISQEVNRFGGILGFVAEADLFPRTTCASSNEGEVFYGVTPDSGGTLRLGEYPREQAIKDAPFLIAHEFSHIIQFEVRLRNNAPLMAAWTAEGQATLAEEVVGHAIEGRMPGQNYGVAVALNLDDPTSIDWYSDAFVDMAAYFGFRSPSARFETAPQECSWLADLGPCLGGRNIYGVPWSLLRWVSDQYGPAFAGGEQGLQRALVADDTLGYANIESVIGVPIETLLARWAAMLYVDDRVPGIDPTLTMPSWNLLDIYEGSYAGTGFYETTRLTPRPYTFTSFTDTTNVRGGSATYILLGSAGAHPATGVRVRSTTGGALPSIMQLFVVRMR